MPHDQEDRPWTEQQWEDFLRQADLRTARYGELMETLMDDPDREEIIDHEMGWDRKREAADEQWLQEISEAYAQAQEELESLDQSAADSEEPDRPARKRLDRDDQELESIPAYAACQAASLAIDRALEPLLHDHEDQEDEDVAQAFIQIKIACAKIAGGHGMGYEDEVIGGNLVNCKRALTAVEQCELALRLIQKRNLLPTAAMPALFDHVAQAHKAISDRIAELRGRMWWQE